MAEGSRPEPSAWVVRHAPLIRRGGHVLDLAAGSGRHARHLLAAGFRVTAVDLQVEGLADLAPRPLAEVVRADLENGTWPFEGLLFDAVVVTNYLHRPLLPRLPQLLPAGGVLLYETFMRGNERYGRPGNPDFLLRPGELLDVCSGLYVVAFEQGAVTRPRSAVVQRIAALQNPVSENASPPLPEG